MATEKWSAKKWVESEIFAIESTYDNTRAEAVEFVTETLQIGEYRDALTDRQVAAALRYITKKAKQK